MSCVELIRQKLIKEFNPTFLEVLDESEQHRGHAGHLAGGRHYSITISSLELSNTTRLQSHRKIYQLFTDLMPLPIHALKIKVV